MDKIEQAKQAKAILERKNIEDELSENQLTVLSLLKKSKNKLSVSEIVSKTDVSRNTVRKVLERLRDLQLIKQTGLGRGAKWVVVK